MFKYVPVIAIILASSIATQAQAADDISNFSKDAIGAGSPSLGNPPIGIDIKNPPQFPDLGFQPPPCNNNGKDQNLNKYDGKPQTIACVDVSPAAL